MNAVSAGSADGMTRGALSDEMQLLEEDIKKRLPVGWSCSYQALFNDYVIKKGFSAHAVERTLFVMEKRETIRFTGHVSPYSIFDVCLADYFHRKRWCTDPVYNLTQPISLFLYRCLLSMDVYVSVSLE
jgi:hypothetical protein